MSSINKCYGDYGHMYMHMYTHTLNEYANF